MVANATKVTKEEVRTRLDEILHDLTASAEAIEIEDSGETVAVLLSPEEYKRYRRERAWEAIRKLQARNAHRDPDEVYREVTKIVEEVRQELYEERLAASGGS